MKSLFRTIIAITIVLAVLWLITMPAAYLLEYVVEYWTGGDLPINPITVIAGVLLLEVTIPAALITYVVSFVV